MARLESSVFALVSLENGGHPFSTSTTIGLYNSYKAGEIGEQHYRQGCSIGRYCADSWYGPEKDVLRITKVRKMKVKYFF